MSDRDAEVAELRELLGLAASLSGSAPPERDTLDALVRRCQRAVPTGIPALDQDLLGQLGRLVETGAITADRLLPALLDEDDRLRSEAAPRFAVLAQLPTIRHRLCRHLDEPPVGEAVAQALLPWLDRDPVVLDAFVERARDEPLDSWWTTRALIPVSPLPEPLREALVDVLLGHWGEEASKTVEALASELPTDAWVREAFYDLLADRSLASEVAEALADHAHAPPIRDALVDRLTDPDDRVRFWATSALCQHIADDPALATLLHDMLDDEDPEIRAEAAVAWIRLDGDDPSARRTLDALRAEGGWLARSLDHRLAAEPSPTAASPATDESRIEHPSTMRDPVSRLDDRSVELGFHSSSLDLLVEVHERLAPYLDHDGPISEYLRGLGSDVPERLRTAVDDLLDPTMPPPRPWYRADMVGLRIDPALVPYDPDDPIAIAHAIRTTPGQLHRRNDRQAMLEHLAHPDPIVRMVAVEALAPRVAQADVHAVIVERLTTDIFPVRLATARTLCRLPDRKIVPADLWTRLEAWLAVDTDPAWTRAEFGHPHEVRDAMAQRIGRRAARDRATHRRLVEQLDADRFAVRLGAVLALLERPGSLSRAVQGAIVRALRDRRGHESLVPRLDAAEQLIDSSRAGEHDEAATGEAVADERITELADEALRFGTRPWEHLSWAPSVRVRAIALLDRSGRPWPRDRRLDIARHDRHADVRDAAYRSWRRS